MRQLKNSGSVFSPLLALMLVATGVAAECLFLSGVMFAEEGLPRGKPAGGYDKVSFACGSATTVVTGRVIYRDSSGASLPLRHVKFIVSTNGTVHSNPVARRVKVTLGEDGSFSFPLSLWSDSVEYYQGGQQVAWDDVEDKGTVNLQARGCDELIFGVDSEWHEQDLEMKCPGKH